MSGDPDDGVVIHPPIPLAPGDLDRLLADGDTAAHAPDAAEQIFVSGLTISPGVATVGDDRYPSIEFRFFGQDNDDRRWAVPPITLILDPRALRDIARGITTATQTAIAATNPRPHIPPNRRHTPKRGRTR